MFGRIFDKIMDAELYENILKDFLLPFLEKAFEGQKLPLYACRITTRNTPANLPKTGMQKIALTGGQHRRAVLT
jgi:hypothetical protein